MCSWLSFYWNFYKNGSNITEDAYSFAYAAAELGYSSFRFDRLGTGNETERPDDGYNVAQGPTEVGILTNILEQARQNNTIGGQQWNKTVLIGHSYGSAQSQAVSYLRPDLVDGVVLTGFSTYSVGASYYVSFNFAIAKHQ
jgi:pimeloyl-ACP methyl ester carboxylesterase